MELKSSPIQHAYLTVLSRSPALAYPFYSGADTLCIQHEPTFFKNKL